MLIYKQWSNDFIIQGDSSNEFLSCNDAISTGAERWNFSKVYRKWSLMQLKSTETCIHYKCYCVWKICAIQYQCNTRPKLINTITLSSTLIEQGIAYKYPTRYYMYINMYMYNGLMNQGKKTIVGIIWRTADNWSSKSRNSELRSNLLMAQEKLVTDIWVIKVDINYIILTEIKINIML